MFQSLLTTLTNPLGYLILNTFHYRITNSRVLKDIHLVKAEQYFHDGERLKFFKYFLVAKATFTLNSI